MTGQCHEQSTCPSQCTTCSDTGLCTSCQTGYYGTQCNQMCLNSCNGGCHQNGTCYQCSNANVYGLNCNIQCSSLCVNDTCDRWTGECPLQCSSRCEVCDSNTGKCMMCKDRKLYGNNCQYSCNSGCGTLACNQTTGECFSCSNGLWGAFCNASCSIGCSSSGCDRESGKCFECANKTLYGDLCETLCSDYCVKNQCEQKGECSFGCDTNQFSQMCKTKCSCNETAIGNGCDEVGRCLERCVPAYTERDCETCKRFKYLIIMCRSRI